MEEFFKLRNGMLPVFILSKVAVGILFLASAKASYITGTDLLLDDAESTKHISEIEVKH